MSEAQAEIIPAPRQGKPALANAPASGNPVDFYLARLGSRESRRAMHASLDLIAKLLSKGSLDARAFPWHRLRYPETQAIRAWLAKGQYAPSTVNRHLAALRGVLRECLRLGLIDERAHREATDLARMPNERPPAGRMLSREEIAQLFAAAAESLSPQRERDQALLAIAYCCGLRRFEVAGLDRADLDPADGKLTVRVAKGGRCRVVFLPPQGLEYARAWLRVRGDWPGPLLLPMNKSGKPQRTRLSGDGVEHVLKSLGERAGVAHFSPHDLRRSCISELLERGVDLALVQKLAGHQKPETTSRYDRRGDERKREAAALVDVPLA